MGPGNSKDSTTKAIMRTTFSSELVIVKQRQTLTAIAVSGDHAKIITVLSAHAARSEGPSAKE